MKYKMVYGNPQDNFIWKMIPIYSPLEKLHLKLAKWHLRKLTKVDKEMLDKLWLRCYNDIINKKIENPWGEYVLDKDMVDKIIEKINEVGHINAMSSEDIKIGLENTANTLKGYSLWEVEPMCNAVVELKGDNNESTD